MSDPVAFSRRLVAVFAADVEGYSRLMGADELGTLRGLTERRAILDRFIGEHRGRIANTAGDSVLAEFASAVEAVQCAVDAQTALAEANASVAPDRRISFRIGVHVGDVIVRAGDLFGEGVNIAARLQTLAKPGSVCISRETYDQVRKVLPITFTDLGAQHVKNIQEPIRAYQVGVPNEVRDATPADVAEAESLPPIPDKPSIAVLPFQNISGDPKQQYFADGMAEDITTALSRFKSLFVIARNSAFSYKDKAIDVKRVGRELGVRYVLQGSVRKAGNILRIAAQLIDAASGANTWADRFDGVLEDVFEFQDEVTAKVVGAIAPRMERAEIKRARRKPPSSTDAYDCYLRGLACLSPMTADGMEQALGLFTRAYSLDPDYASAYGMAMHCHAHRFDLLLVETEDIAHRRSEISRLWQMVARVGQDDGVALGEAAWAVAYLLRDLSSARQLIDQALELNPNLASAWANSGWISIWQGHPDLAIEHIGRAERLDPGSLRLTSFAAMAHARFFLAEYETALSLAERMLRYSSDAHVCLRIGAASAAFAGHIDRAHGLAARLQVVDPAFGVSRLREYLGPYQKSEFVEKYAKGLRLAGLPE
jgi:TolB-like protein/class 3 adenylate cyclase